MYLISFWWLNLPRGRAKKLHPINSATCWSGLSSNFCNMLMCATIGPQGCGFYTSPKWGKSTADTTDTGEYECMCDIWRSGWGGCWEIPDRLYCRNKPPKGHAWSPFLKTHTHMHTPHSLSLYPEVHTLPPSALPLFYVHTYTQTHTSLLLRIQPSQLICLKVNLPPYYYPSSNPVVPNSQPLLYIPTERKQISPSINSTICAIFQPIFVSLTFLTWPLFVPTKTSEWFL